MNLIHSEPTTSTVKDPVCGMTVDPAKSNHVYCHDRQNYYFCCAHCLEKFTGAPEKYLTQTKSSPPPGLIQLGVPNPAGTTSKSDAHPAPVSSIKKRANAAFYVCPMCPEVREAQPGPCPSRGMALEPEAPPATARTEYTCPMHPEIVRSEPGSCPVCGMALEPRTVAATEEENPELRDMTRRFLVGMILTMPLLAIAMGSMIWRHDFMQILEGPRIPWLEFLLATPVVLWCGLPFFQRFWT